MSLFCEYIASLDFCPTYSFPNCTRSNADKEVASGQCHDLKRNVLIDVYRSHVKTSLLVVIYMKKDESTDKAGFLTRGRGGGAWPHLCPNVFLQN